MCLSLLVVISIDLNIYYMSDILVCSHRKTGLDLNSGLVAIQSYIGSFCNAEQEFYSH